MRMFDANVLVHRFRPDAERHEEFRTWLELQVAGPEAFGVSELVLSGFGRVVTHPSIFDPPNGLADCLFAARQIRDHPNCVALRPGGGTGVSSAISAWRRVQSATRSPMDTLPRWRSSTAVSS